MQDTNWNWDLQASFKPQEPMTAHEIETDTSVSPAFLSKNIAELSQASLLVVSTDPEINSDISLRLRRAVFRELMLHASSTEINLILDQAERSLRSKDPEQQAAAIKIFELIGEYGASKIEPLVSSTDPKIQLAADRLLSRIEELEKDSPKEQAFLERVASFRGVTDLRRHVREAYFISFKPEEYLDEVLPNAVNSIKDIQASVFTLERGDAVAQTEALRELAQAGELASVATIPILELVHRNHLYPSQHSFFLREEALFTLKSLGPVARGATGILCNMLMDNFDDDILATLQAINPEARFVVPALIYHLKAGPNRRKAAKALRNLTIQSPEVAERLRADLPKLRGFIRFEVEHLL